MVTGMPSSRAYHLSTMPPVEKVTGKDIIDKTLNDANLVPAVLLNFFWVSSGSGLKSSVYWPVDTRL